uniref:SLH domain-containing protein n=1 Tax=Caldicellulosiruptor owensensis TaxID=55205 RepID=A0A7C5V3R6_9FIRM
MKNTFRKVTVLLFSVVLIFMTACGNGPAKKTSQPKATAQPKQTVLAKLAQTAPAITTAKGFTEALLSRARVEPATFEQAKTLGIVPAEVKPGSVLTRAQASYIMWNAIKKIDYLKVKNIPVSTAVYDLWESYLSGKDVVLNPGYCTMAAYQFFDFLRYEINYADGKKDVKFVYNPILLNGKCAMDSYDTVRQLIQTFKKKYPKQLKIAIPERPNIKVVKNVKRVLRYKINKDNSKEPKEAIKGDLYYILFERNKTPYEYILENGEIVQYKPVVLFFTGYELQKRPSAKDYTDTNDKYIFFIMPKIDPRYNKYIYNYLKSLPRRYKYYDYRRFEAQGYIEDIKSIPRLYKEAVLRMFDLGIYIWDKSPFYCQKVRAKPGKTLSEQEANELLNRLFDKSKRDVFDEFSNRAALYMTPAGDVICGLSNIGKVDDLKMDPWDLDSVVRECDGAIFDTQIVTLRLLPSVAHEFKYRVKEDPFIKDGVVPQLSMAFASGFGLNLDDHYFYGLYFTLFGTPVTRAKSGLPGIVCMPDDYLVTPKMVASEMDSIPEAYKKQAREDAKYYYSKKTKALLPKKPGVIVQYGDLYLYRFAVSTFGGDVYFSARAYYEKPNIPGAKLVVAKPDKRFK